MATQRLSSSGCTHWFCAASGSHTHRQASESMASASLELVGLVLVACKVSELDYHRMRSSRLSLPTVVALKDSLFQMNECAKRHYSQNGARWG